MSERNQFHQVKFFISFSYSMMVICTGQRSCCFAIHNRRTNSQEFNNFETCRKVKAAFENVELYFFELIFISFLFFFLVGA